MAIKSFKKLPNASRETEKLQSNLEVYLKPITDSQIINGVLLKEVLLRPEIRNEVQHRLGRKPLGWLIVRKRADSRIWDIQDTNPGPNETLSIACSHRVIVDMWIF